MEECVFTLVSDLCVGEFTWQKLMGVGIRCKSKWSGVCECDQEASACVVARGGQRILLEAWLWETLGLCGVTCLLCHGRCVRG